ncbi:ABC transporter permease [Alteromonas sp. CYL-A6]|uniref:ABC transporter permease n=1 Tax=Alteromonas nitratireducens TaxID=3390813 RepID=UPI0034BD295E
MILSLATASLRHRRASVVLTLISVIISVSLLVSVEFIRGQIKDSFTRTVSGVDLIVGAPTGQLNLLLYSVFRIGNPTQAIDWQDVAWLKENPSVDWLVPIALGDAHKGFRVVGTNNTYFSHFKYADKRALAFRQGGHFTSDRAAVIGADVAAELGYQTGDSLIISHGLGEVSFSHHDEAPFTITGILDATGTPVDKAVYVTLHGLESIHGQPATTNLRRLSRPDVKSETETHHHEDAHTLSDAVPGKVSAVMVGLKNRVTALQLQYQINQSKAAPLLAILPGVALAQLWEMMGNIEKLLLGISVLILLASLVGLTTMLLASMRERRQEIAVLRAIGAGPAAVLWLIQLEALLISGLACAISVLIVQTGFGFSADWLSKQYGLFIGSNIFTLSTAVIIGCVMVATWLISFIPAIAAYRQALHSGLQKQ